MCFDVDDVCVELECLVELEVNDVLVELVFLTELEVLVGFLDSVVVLFEVEDVVVFGANVAYLVASAFEVVY